MHIAASTTHYAENLGVKTASLRHKHKHSSLLIGPARCVVVGGVRTGEHGRWGWSSWFTTGAGRSHHPAEFTTTPQWNRSSKLLYSFWSRFDQRFSEWRDLREQGVFVFRQKFNVSCFFSLLQVDTIERITTTYTHRLMPHVPQKFYRYLPSTKHGEFSPPPPPDYCLTVAYFGWLLEILRVLREAKMTREQFRTKDADSCSLFAILPEQNKNVTTWQIISSLLCLWTNRIWLKCLKARLA